MTMTRTMSGDLEGVDHDGILWISVQRIYWMHDKIIESVSNRNSY